MKEWINLRKNNVYIVYSGPPRRIWARQGPTFYPNFFDQLFLIRAYWNPKFRQGPGIGGLSNRGGPAITLSDPPNSGSRGEGGLSPSSNEGSV